MTFTWFLVATMFGQASTPDFVATTASRTQSGPLRAISKNWSVTLGDQPPLSDLISLRRVETPRPDWPREPGAILANGDRIPGSYLGGNGTAITLKTSWNANGLRIPLPAIRVLWLTAIPATTLDFVDRYEWLDAKRKTDLILLRNGDTLAGDIEAFNNTNGLQFRRSSDGLSVTVEITAISAIAFNPSLSLMRKIRGPYAHLVLKDGTRLQFVQFVTASIEKDQLRGSSAFGTRLEIPISQLIALDLRQGKATSLTELQPIRQQFEPYGELGWPWTTDRTVKGRPLRLQSPYGPSTYDTGLGTHPKTTLTYSLKKKYRRFTALVGLDAVTGQRGAAAVKILVDGREQSLPELARLSAGGKPVSVEVELTGAEELTLIIDYGPTGDVQADVNWVDAWLIGS